MSRTAKTEAFYANTYRLIRQRVAREGGAQVADFVAPIAIVEHLIKRKPDLSKRTWQLYKAAIGAQFEAAIADAPDRVVSQEFEFALQKLSAERQTGALTRGRRTSALKAKGVSTEDFHTLTKYIERNVGQHKRARALLVTCHATQLVGLRPSEWLGADKVSRDGRTYLVVKNAKATNGRGNGETRSLDLTDCTPEQVDWIDRMLELVDGHRAPGEYAELQKALGQYICWAARKALSRRKRYPSLYSFRHQFAADAKLASIQAGDTKAAVAALMGHGSEATAGRNYAKSKAGRSGSAIRPLQSQVATVRPAASRPTSHEK
ncbi:hypothetical protein ACW0US_17945 [Xanthomonas euvesicatoria]